MSLTSQVLGDIFKLVDTAKKTRKTDAVFTQRAAERTPQITREELRHAQVVRSMHGVGHAWNEYVEWQRFVDERAKEGRPMSRSIICAAVAVAHRQLLDELREAVDVLSRTDPMSQPHYYTITSTGGVERDILE